MNAPSPWLRSTQMRWRLTSLPLRLAVQAGAAAAIGVISFAVLRTVDFIDATAASVIVAVFFGVFTVLQQRQSQRRQHTVELITAFQTAEQLCAADRWMARRITAGESIETDIGADDEAHVIVMLDYYEFLAVLAQRGMIDVALLMDLRGGAMARCYHLSEAYIADRREHIWRNLYGGLDIFITAHSRRQS